jgi:transcriptional regulator with XRE-family HTH domain
MISSKPYEQSKKAVRRFRSAVPLNGQAMAERERIAKKLRSLREAKGLSQAKLGELIGVVQPVIGRFETAKRSMMLEHVMALAPHLDVHPAELLPPAQAAVARNMSVAAASNTPLHDLIEDRARKDGDYAIAFALLKLADVLGQVADRSADSER